MNQFSTPGSTNTRKLSNAYELHYWGFEGGLGKGGTV